MIVPFIILCMVTAICLGGALPLTTKMVFGQTITGGLLASAPPGSHLIAARGMVGPIADRLISNATHIRDNIVDDFSCFGRTYGYYADQSNDCQVFHVCVPLKQLFPDFFDEADINHFSFICPKYTVFSQDAMVCAWANEALDCSVAHQLYHINSNFFVPKEEEFNRITTMRPNISPSKAPTTTEVSPKEQRSNGRRLDASYTYRQQLITEQSEPEIREYGSKENFNKSFEITTPLSHDDGFHQESTALPILQWENAKLEVSTARPENEGDYDSTLYQTKKPSDSKTNIQGSVIIGNQDIYYKSIVGPSTQNSMQGFENKDNSSLKESESMSINIFSGRHLNTNGNQIQDIVNTKDYFEKKIYGVDSNHSLHENNDIKENVTKSIDEENSVNVTQSQMVASSSTTHPSRPIMELSATIRSRGPYRSSTPSPRVSNRRTPSQIYRTNRYRIDSSRNNNSLSSSMLSSILPNTTSNSTKTYIQTTSKPLMFDSTPKPFFITTEHTTKTTSAISDYSTFRSYRFTAAPREISQRRETYKFSRPNRYQNRVKQLSQRKRLTVPIPSTIITISTDTILQDVTTPTTVETIPSSSAMFSTSTATTIQEVTTPTVIFTSPSTVVTSPSTVVTSPSTVVTSPSTVVTSPSTVVTSPSTPQTTKGSYRFTAAPRPAEVTRSWMSFRASLKSRSNYRYSRPNRYG